MPLIVLSGMSAADPIAASLVSGPSPDGEIGPGDDATYVVNLQNSGSTATLQLFFTTSDPLVSGAVSSANPVTIIGGGNANVTVVLSAAAGLPAGQAITAELDYVLV